MFSWALEHHATGFRPTAPELIEYLWKWRESNPPDEVLRLPEVPLDHSDKKEIGRMLKALGDKLSTMPDPPERERKRAAK